MPLGSPISKRTDVAIVAATNKDCQIEIAQGRLRKDFFYRIGVIEMMMPPLRERKDDLPLLIEHILADYRQKHLEVSGQNMPIVPADQSELPGELIQALYAYDWPGNVRELQNVLQRYLVTRDLMSTLTRIAPSEGKRGIVASPSLPASMPLPEALKAFEKQKIAELLALNHYNVRKTASMLGIPIPTLYYKIKYHSIKK
jgi:transcriptional regulator with PAS, ATPase and Fis domain